MQRPYTRIQHVCQRAKFQRGLGLSRTVQRIAGLPTPLVSSGAMGLGTTAGAGHPPTTQLAKSSARHCMYMPGLGRCVMDQHFYTHSHTLAWWQGIFQALCQVLIMHGPSAVPCSMAPWLQLQR